MDAYKTSNGEREDLADLETNPIIGFIGDQIFPVVNAAEKTGSIYYADLEADAAVQTGRTLGVAPTRTLIAANVDTFTCAEKVKRYGMALSEVKQVGGIEVADAFGAAASKRSVQRGVEEAVADAVLLGAGITVDDIEASFVTAAQVGLNAIRRYPGRTAFVASYTIFNRIMRYTEVTGRFGLSSAAVSGVDAVDIVARRPEALKLLLAGIIGVDEVLIGDDDQWYTSDAAKQDRAALVKLPDPGQLSHKENAVFGKNLMYLPDGSQPYVIESFYDNDTKVNVYDATIWHELKTLNTGAAYILSGLDEGNTVITTV